jgi:carbonic anhydrase
MRKIAVIFLLLAIASCTKWSYSGHNGPAAWGTLDEKYKFCKVGYNQSPIDIISDFKEHELKFNHTDSTIVKEKKDYNLALHFYGENFLFRGKKKYLLRNLEFRHPSEHLVKGKSHSLEMQITYKSEDEQSLRLAFFLDLGDKENAKFSSLVKFLSSKEKEGKVDIAALVPTNDTAFFYEGSNTVPPCREGVKWYVMKTPILLSKDQLNQIIKSTIFVPSNARPVQKFNPENY